MITLGIFLLLLACVIFTMAVFPDWKELLCKLIHKNLSYDQIMIIGWTVALIGYILMFVS